MLLLAVVSAQKVRSNWGFLCKDVAERKGESRYADWGDGLPFGDGALVAPSGGIWAEEPTPPAHGVAGGVGQRSPDQIPVLEDENFTIIKSERTDARLLDSTGPNAYKADTPWGGYLYFRDGSTLRIPEDVNIVRILTVYECGDPSDCPKPPLYKLEKTGGATVWVDGHGNVRLP